MPFFVCLFARGWGGVWICFLFFLEWTGAVWVPAETIPAYTVHTVHTLQKRKDGNSKTLWMLLKITGFLVTKSVRSKDKDSQVAPKSFLIFRLWSAHLLSSLVEWSISGNPVAPFWKQIHSESSAASLLMPQVNIQLKSFSTLVPAQMGALSFKLLIK